MGQCPEYATDVPQGLVVEGYQTWSGFAANTLSAALSEISNLQQLNFSPITYSISLGVPDSHARPFDAPSPPEGIDVEADWGQAPTDPSLATAYLPAFSSAPTFDGVAPTFQYPEPVARPNIRDPGSPPRPQDLSLPDEPVLAFPDVPTLQDINLPSVPNLQLPTFNANPPSEDSVVVPDLEFNFTDEPFSDALLDQIKAKVSEWLGGGTGLPNHIWDMIWDQARNREAATATAAHKETVSEWASRGFALPGGVLDAKLQEAREKQWEQENTLAREIATQQAKMEVENLRFAIEQGIVLMQLLGNLHDQTMQRAFAVAQYTLEAKIKVFDAQVTFYNAQMQVYQTKASVYKTRLEAELVHLELYKAELEGKRIVGELNKLEVETYKAQLEGVLAAVEVYKSQVQTVQAQVEIEVARIEAHRTAISAYKERIGAYVAEVEAYAKRIDAEGTKAGIYNSQVQAFLGRTQAYGIEVEAGTKVHNAAIQNNQLLLEQYKAKVGGWSARVGAEAERIKAVLGTYNADAEIYKAQGAIESARVASDAQRYQLALTEATAQAEVLVKTAQMNIEQAQRISALELEASKTAATAYGQLASASLAAVNLSATVSAQHAWTSSTGCTTTYTGDATGA